LKGNYFNEASKGFADKKNLINLIQYKLKYNKYSNSYNKAIIQLKFMYQEREIFDGHGDVTAYKFLSKGGLPIHTCSLFKGDKYHEYRLVQYNVSEFLRVPLFLVMSLYCSRDLQSAGTS
jgi:hypothetical protein